jgi:hypothetical protein
VRVGSVNAGDGPGIAFTHIAPDDLDIAVIGQLPPPQLPFNNKLKPGPLEVERFEASCRGGRLTE